MDLYYTTLQYSHVADFSLVSVVVVEEHLME